MRAWLVLVLAAVWSASGCARPADEPGAAARDLEAAWQTVAVGDMTAGQQAQHELALMAVNSLASELRGELSAALEDGGPAAGIEVCRRQAPEIARRVAAEYELEIGRTSFALRNPDNRPPSWAAAAVEDRADEPLYVAGPDARLGALLPIRLRAECTMCHGDPGDIDEAVLSAVAAAYPTDRATGFAEGDLRGWFWVEVPAPTIE